LALLCLLWIAARAAYLLGGNPAFITGMVLESVFFAYSAVRLMQVMLKGKSVRNYGVPVLVLGLGASNVLFLLATLDGDYSRVLDRFNTGMLFMAVLTILIARRVVPFFAGRMVQGLDIPPRATSGRAQLVLGSVAIIAGLFGLNAVMALALGLVGLLGLYQLWSWKPLSVLHKPMLWILYLGYLGLTLGLIAASSHLLGVGGPLLARAATHVHLIGMGGFAVLIIGMVTRTALGHTGRPLALDRSMLASYWLMVLAVGLRLLALLPTAMSINLLHAAAAAWILSFGLYLYRYVPILIRPRADAKPKLASSPVVPTKQGAHRCAHQPRRLHIATRLNPGECLAPDSDDRLFHAVAYVSWQPSRASLHDCGNRARAWCFRAQSDEDHASSGAGGMDRNHKREKRGDAARM